MSGRLLHVRTIDTTSHETKGQDHFRGSRGLINSAETLLTKVLLCIKRDAPCHLQINWHFHLLNFPIVSSLLHIRKILVHWPFLEISSPKKWVVGATLALKQEFLAATLN